MSEVWAEELEHAIDGDVSTSKDDRDEYSRDWSIFEVEPSAIAFPEHAGDVKSIVDFVSERKEEIPRLSVTPRAAGTGMSGGSLTESLLVSFERLDEFSINDHKATAEPGVYYRDLEEAMEEHGLVYPSYPSSKDICAVGGMVANNCGGEKSLAYGKTQDLVPRMDVVLADGNEYELHPLSEEELEAKQSQDNFEGHVYRELHELIEENYDLIRAAEPDVSKNSSGYNLWDVWDGETFDLNKLFVGSQGTLGVITEADLELVEQKEHSRHVIAFVEELDRLTELVNTVLEYDPECLEAFDIHTLELGIQSLDEIAESMGMDRMELLQRSKQEVELFLEHGLPEFTVIIQLTSDDAEELEDRMHALHGVLDGHDLPNVEIPDEEMAEKYWYMRRNSFKFLSEKVDTGLAAPFIEDFCVKPEQLPEFVPKLYDTLESYDIEPTLAGHAGSGNFHIIPVMDLSSEEDRKKIPKVMDDVHELIEEHGGTISAEHNDGLLRTPYVEEEYGDDVYELFQAVKDIFDPHGIFNPGKKVNGDKHYAMQHMKHDNDKAD